MGGKSSKIRPINPSGENTNTDTSSSTSSDLKTIEMGINKSNTSEYKIHRRRSTVLRTLSNTSKSTQKVAAYCTFLLFLLILTGFIVACFVFPGVVEWMGIYLGLVFWIMFGMGVGATLPELLCTSDSAYHPTEASIEQNSLKSGGCCVVVCGLLGAVLFPLMIPLAILFVMVPMCKKDGVTKTTAMVFVFFLLFAAGCGFAIAGMGIRLCVINTDDVCVIGEHNGTMNLPSGMYLNPPSVWVLNQKPIYDIYAVEGLTEADWDNTWSGGAWLEAAQTGKPLGAARFKHYPRCDSIGAPYSYSNTMELTYPDMMPNGRDYKVSQYCDHVTQYVRTGESGWTQYIIQDCNNKVAYKLEYDLKVFQLDMNWHILDADDNILAQAIKPFQLWEPPIVEFVSPTKREDGSDVLVGKLKQNWCGDTCFKDSWNIEVDRPDVVEHSVFVYLALIIRNIQLEQRSKNNDRRRLGKGGFDFANPPMQEDKLD